MTESRDVTSRSGPRWELAIDFGTSFTTAATLVDGRAEVLEIDGSTSMPSLVCVDEDGSIITGRLATISSATAPDRTERTPKRALVACEHIRLGGRDIEPVDLVAAVLQSVAEEAARRRGGRPPSRVVLTHPARWSAGGVELRRLSEAAHRAGLREPELLAEPIATAQWSASVGRAVPHGGMVAVYDLGGGTFDTAVLRHRHDGFEFAGSPGGAACGGEDLDAAFMQVVGEHAEELDPDRWNGLWEAEGRAADRRRAELRRDAVEAREALSHRTTVALWLPSLDDEIRVTRSEYERAVEPLLARSLAELQDAVARAGTTPDGLVAVHLTGGVSRTPQVARLVVGAFGLITILHQEPRSAAVLGALSTSRDAARATLRDASGPDDAPAPITPAGFQTPTSPPPPAAPEARGEPIDGTTFAGTNHPSPSGAASTPFLPYDPSEGDDVQYTVFRPTRMTSGLPHPLLLYIHRADPQIDALTGEVTDLAEVVGDRARRRLSTESATYRPVVADGHRWLPRGGDLIVEPWLESGRVTPSRAWLRWEEAMHELEFRMVTHADHGRSIEGGFRVYLGIVLVGEVRFRITVGGGAAPSSAQTIVTGRPYRRIFVSYAHDDRRVVEGVLDYARLCGDDFLIDAHALRSGERWQPRLLEMIDTSDVFQLFWSHRSMASRHVRDEWEHALGLRREHFVRPVYWQDPRPEDRSRDLPPASLSAIHWYRLPLLADPAVPSRPSSRPAGAAAGVASGSPLSTGAASAGAAKPSSTRAAGAGEPMARPGAPATREPVRRSRPPTTGRVPPPSPPQWTTRTSSVGSPSGFGPSGYDPDRPLRRQRPSSRENVKSQPPQQAHRSPARVAALAVAAALLLLVLVVAILLALR
ncbi:Hsp70 family protein [Actinomycetospora aeridis]|uniref:Hsp70 family protein n=1 Tax=Actinomycetospora aeridis TaxID=3129231 RepID=A0ABU8N6L6_9PSEU